MFPNVSSRNGELSTMMGNWLEKGKEGQVHTTGSAQWRSHKRRASTTSSRQRAEADQIL